MTVSKKEFLATLVKSGLTELEPIRNWLAESKAADGVALANQLVNQGLLTEWQAKYLLTGRHRLDVGGYRLLNKLGREELGDHFLAIHRQLNRKVEILFLTSRISQDAKRRDDFLRRAGRTMELDHPHLSHVYDLDQEGDRYYLVTEHVAGTRWETAAILDIGPGNLAGIFQNLIGALEYLHENQLYHGKLGSDDLVFDRDLGVKIQNIALGPFRNQIVGTDCRPSAISDWNALGELGHRVWKSVSASADSADTKALEWNFGKLSTSQVPEPILGQLKTLLSRLGSNDSSSLGSPIPTPTLGSPKSGSLVSMTERPGPRHGRVGKSTQVPAAVIPAAGFLQRLTSDPLIFLSSAFLLGVISVGSLTYGLQEWASPGATVASRETVTPSAETADPNRENNRHRQAEETDAGQAGGGNADSNSPALEPSTHPSNSSPASEPLAEGGSTDPAVSQRKDRADAENQPPPNAANEWGTTEWGTTEWGTKNLAEGNLKGEMPPDSAGEASLESRTESVDRSPTGTTPLNTPPNTPPNAPLSTESPNEGQSVAGDPSKPASEQPFQNLPAQTSLPSIQWLDPVKLGEVDIPSRYLLGMELMAAGAIGSGSHSFELARDPEERQKWWVYYVRGTSDRKTGIAVLRREDQDLIFQWLEEARNIRQAGYLRNCVLKIFTPEQSAWLRLREPVELEPLMLSQNSLTAFIPIEIEFPPSTDLWLIEILKPDIEEISINPRIIDLKQGLAGRVLLKEEDKKPLVWVNLELDSRQKTRLRGDLAVFEGHARASATSVERFAGRSLKNLAELETLASFWKNQDQLLGQQIQAIDSTPARPGMGETKKNTLAELRKQQTMAREFGTALSEYQSLAPKMLDQPYGIRIAARFPDGIEVELAKSKMTTPASQDSPD